MMHFLQQNFESFDSRESIDEDNGSRKKPRARRNSIPELVGEAKKFMFGSLAKRLEKAAESKGALKDRRGTLKNLQVTTSSHFGICIVFYFVSEMPTYELPDLEENLDEASDSPQERRHSVDTPMTNNPGNLCFEKSKLPKTQTRIPIFQPVMSWAYMRRRLLWSFIISNRLQTYINGGRISSNDN
ncbi:unnamed protein product [Cylicostephanus goldi]|uniref:Uncharacterized protein n=1 Tax=Cylicostephanus goldi TaxID=71465 RepID=A0A3P6RFA2_CYLGO|nr:unnamed protein product [Cylicostephanus goldi]